MDLYYKIRNTVRDFWYDLRRRCQRFKRGYAWSDVWSLDDWFMRTLKPMLSALREHGQGVPMEFENNPEGWADVLTEMINCLELMDEDGAEKHLGITDDNWSVENHKKVAHLMEESKNRFFELFSKYFYDLWD